MLRLQTDLRKSDVVQQLRSDTHVQLRLMDNVLTSLTDVTSWEIIVFMQSYKPKYEDELRAIITKHMDKTIIVWDVMDGWNFTQVLDFKKQKKILYFGIDINSDLDIQQVAKPSDGVRIDDRWIYSTYMHHWNLTNTRHLVILQPEMYYVTYIVPAQSSALPQVFYPVVNMQLMIYQDFTTTWNGRALVFIGIGYAYHADLALLADERPTYTDLARMIRLTISTAASLNPFCDQDSLIIRPTITDQQLIDFILYYQAIEIMYAPLTELFQIYFRVHVSVSDTPRLGYKRYKNLCRGASATWNSINHCATYIKFLNHCDKAGIFKKTKKCVIVSYQTNTIAFVANLFPQLTFYAYGDQQGVVKNVHYELLVQQSLNIFENFKNNFILIVERMTASTQPYLNTAGMTNRIDTDYDNQQLVTATQPLAYLAQTILAWNVADDTDQPILPGTTYSSSFLLESDTTLYVENLAPTYPLTKSFVKPQQYEQYFSFINTYLRVITFDNQYLAELLAESKVIDLYGGNFANYDLWHLYQQLEAYDSVTRQKLIKQLADQFQYYPGRLEESKYERLEKAKDVNSISLAIKDPIWNEAKSR